MIYPLLALLVSAASYAQTIEIQGRNPRFEMSVKLTDVTGEGSFTARQTRLENFYFEYVPITSPRSPRELHLVDIFGRRRIEFRQEDVELVDAGAGISAPDEGATGYYLRFRLKKRARQIISRYRYIGLGMGPFGTPRGPHHVLLLNDDEDYTEGKFRWSTWHRLDVGQRVFLESMLVCERALGTQSKRPDIEASARD